MNRSVMSVFGIAIVGLVSCSDDPGRLVHGIVQGQNQHVVAGADELPEFIGWKLARSKDGTITGSLIDFALPAKAYAQGSQVVVNGSPVPGAVVCIEDVAGLVPFVRCTNTDANGLATFFIEVETTLAKEYRAEIRGTLNGAPAVFDTIVATVEPSEPRSDYWFGTVTASGSPAVAGAFGVIDAYGNNIPYRIVGDAHLTVAGDTVGTLAARTVSFDTTSIAPETWRQTELRVAGGTLAGYLGYRIFKAGQTLSIEWHSYGLNRTH